MSRSLACRISSSRSSSATAIASSAASFTPLSSRASVRDASLADRQMSAIDETTVAIAPKGRRSVHDEVVAVHGLLARARHHLARRAGLHPLDLAQLLRGVVADALAQRVRCAAVRVRLGDVHGIAQADPDGG